jgi:hypothetical protein
VSAASAAALGRQQLKGLDALNQLVEKNVRAMNDPLTKLVASPSPTAAPTRNRSIYHA